MHLDTINAGHRYGHDRHVAANDRQEIYRRIQFWRIKTCQPKSYIGREVKRVLIMIRRSNYFVAHRAPRRMRMANLGRVVMTMPMTTKMNVRPSRVGRVSGGMCMRHRGELRN